MGAHWNDVILGLCSVTINVPAESQARFPVVASERPKLISHGEKSKKAKTKNKRK